MLALACGAQFMVVLDVSVVNVALPSIRDALGFQPAQLQWVVNAYALVFAGFLLLGGRLADLYGRRRIFLTGLSLFTLASLVGGLASGPGTLIAARAVQGLGAAVLAPATLTILTTTFAEGPPRTRALAIWTAVGVGGGAAGSLVGGLLTQYLSWRSILLVNVPIGAVALFLAVRHLAGDHGAPATRRLDLPGAVLATMGLGSLTYGITRIESTGWRDPGTLWPLVLGGGALAAFVLVEARFAAAPLIPPRLLRLRAVSAGNLVMLLAGACFGPMWYFLSLSMQNVLHYGALRTGLGFLPHTLVTMVVGWRVTPWLLRHLPGRTLIVAGAVLAASGFVWQSGIGADSDYISGILGPAIVLSTGSGLLLTPITAAVTSGVGEQDAGAASGLMNTTKQVGGALGLAVLVAVAAGPGTTPDDLAADYGRAFLTIAGILLVVAAMAIALPSRRPEGRVR
ncbi:MFS transporter [Amycolatopsis cihanbeyliensis]